MRYKSWDKNWNHTGFQESPSYNGQLPENYEFLNTVNEISSLVLRSFPNEGLPTLRSKFREICLERGLNMPSSCIEQ